MLGMCKGDGPWHFDSPAGARLNIKKILLPVDLPNAGGLFIR
jgi:hypothetical protein